MKINFVIVFSLPCIVTDLRTLNSHFKKCVKLLFPFASRHNIIQLKTMHIDVMSGRLTISNPPWRSTLGEGLTVPLREVSWRLQMNVCVWPGPQFDVIVPEVSPWLALSHWRCFSRSIIFASCFDSVHGILKGCGRWFEDGVFSLFSRKKNERQCQDRNIVLFCLTTVVPSSYSPSTPNVSQW